VAVVVTGAAVLSGREARAVILQVPVAPVLAPVAQQVAVRQQADTDWFIIHFAGAQAPVAASVLAAPVISGAAAAAAAGTAAAADPKHLAAAVHLIMEAQACRAQPQITGSSQVQGR